ncbi:hypothetical protein NIES208_11675 [[Limnothrix rosea] IAM M-220]|nr:hypothetical protein NIES208_11675 [[Limnothrix rosea] IAM M-220]
MQRSSNFKPAKPAKPAIAPTPVIPLKASTASSKQSPAQAPHKQLKLLGMGQRFTQFLAIATIGTAIGLYASTVYNQKAWGDAYAKLDRLRDDEQGFVTNNESIKQQLVEQSEEPDVPLETPKPDHNVFVPAPPSVKLHPQTKPSLQPINNQAPIGY